MDAPDNGLKGAAPFAFAFDSDYSSRVIVISHYEPDLGAPGASGHQGVIPELRIIGEKLVDVLVSIKVQGDKTMAEQHSCVWKRLKLVLVPSRLRFVEGCLLPFWDERTFLAPFDIKQNAVRRSSWTSLRVSVLAEPMVDAITV